MPRLTPQYRLTFNQRGDPYSAAADLDRFIVIDNQLKTLSSVVGDGILTGWNMSAGTGLEVEVSPGSGFISNVLHVTLSVKSGTLVDNATQSVYLQSNLITSSSGFILEVESPSSITVSDTFVDIVAPSDPTNFTASAVDYGTVNLFWDENSEPDFDHYEIQRNLVTIATPTVNGAAPNNPYQDTGLDSETNYSYRIRAVDLSGNASAWVSAIPDPVTTPADTRTPADATRLRLFPGSGQVGIVFDPSPASDLLKYYLTYDLLDTDRSVLASFGPVDIGTSETHLVTGLTNGALYRFTIQSVRMPGSTEILSNGISAEASPRSLSGPASPTAFSATPGIGSISLSWLGSTSATGSAVGQKSSYRVRVVSPGEPDSAPIDVGLGTLVVLNSFNEAAVVGTGPTRFFEDDVSYLFKLTTIDAYGNESGTVLAKASTIDATPPVNPRSLAAVAGDTVVSLSWRHGQSADVVGYEIYIDTGLGFGPAFSPDGVIGYVEEFDVTGLTNGIPTVFRVKAIDDAGNKSTGTTIAATPAEDTIPPAVPAFVRATPGDEQVILTWAGVDDADLSHFLVERSAITQSVSVDPTQELTIIAGSTITFNVGNNTRFVDIGLTNGQTYVYTVSSVDVRGNVSDPTGRKVVAPAPGLNEPGPDRLEAPDNVAASFGSGAIAITWDYAYFGAMLVLGDWVFTVNTDAAPTAFNIYRSDNSVSNFQLIDSVGTNVREYEDTSLLNGQTYYYRVTAVRDNASVIVDTGSIQPPNSIFLGTVVTDAGAITSIENSQRIAAQLESTLTEETLARLLLHKHSTMPINGVSVDATSLLSMIDIRDLSSIDLTALDLSESALAYFQSVGKDSAGQDIVFDDNTTYILSPNNIVHNIPSAADFQVLINSSRPTVQFRFDEDTNAFIFSEALADTDQVSLDGLGQTYYVPAQLDLRFQGMEVLVNGSTDSSALVDEALQTIRFIVPKQSSDAVSVLVDPLVPDFGNQRGARQVSLSPDIVLNDFTRLNDKKYVSASGIFDESDTVFVLFNGSRDAPNYTIDFSEKTIIFDDAVPADSQVALEIRNQEEVQDLLPAKRVAGLDASSFKSGQFLKAQLPDLSHEGRVMERAYPIFATTSSPNKYVYQAQAGEVGSATTAYALAQVQDGVRLSFLMGTSRGLLKSSKGVFRASGDDADDTEDLGGFQFEATDPIVDIARAAVKNSGRTRGTILLDNVIAIGGGADSDVTLVDPSMIEMDDGRIMITGGKRDNGQVTESRTFVFDPSTGEAQTIAVPTTPTVYGIGQDAALSLLASGKVLATGGYPTFLDGNYFSVGTCFLFTPILETWAQTGSMLGSRFGHSMRVLDPTDPTSPILVAGGLEKQSAFDGSGIDQDVLLEPPTKLFTAELFSPSLETWSSAASMVLPSANAESFLDAESVVVDDFDSRQIYDITSGTWTKVDPVLKKQSQVELAEVDGIIKQFFFDSTGSMLAVTRNSVYESVDAGLNFSKMKGLDSVGVVHAVSEVDGTLFAATDLGVYVITSTNRDISTWFQGGLIGAGTTETFDLQPLDNEMIAATEIGVFASGDDGETWAELASLENVYNVELLGDQTLFAQSNMDLYRSDDAGANWTISSTQSFFGPETIMLARAPGELFAGTSEGLYRSVDGMNFRIVEFGVNRDRRRNNVHMVSLLGNDVVVGYDNVVFFLGPDLEESRFAEFVGVIPTVRANGSEVKSGFRYDISRNQVVFEKKRLTGDVISVAANYALFQLSGGGWYEQNPNAPVRVFVDGVEQTGEDIQTDSRLGQISFQDALQKFEAVTISVPGTTLKNEGELFHSELEDELERVKGLPLSLGRNYTADLLQLGLSIEHNFLERGLERDQYYCVTGSEVDRSFNSFWINSEFYILGRRDFDTFNSTIDYAEESSEKRSGSDALVPLCSLEVSPTDLWVGTDNGIFVLDPSSAFSVSDTIEVGSADTAVRDMIEFRGNVWVATQRGIYEIENGIGGPDVTQNPGDNLPDSVFAIGALSNILVAGTSDAVYYSEDSGDSPYSIWFRAGFSEKNSTADISISGACHAISVKDGTAFAAIGDSIFSSTDGKRWERAFQFDPDLEIKITRMAIFAEMLFLGTSAGVYNDRQTSRTDSVKFTLEMLESTEEESQGIYVNDLYPGTDTLFVASDKPYVYKRLSEAWSRTDLPVPAQEVTETSLGQVVAISNNQVFVE